MKWLNVNKFRREILGKEWTMGWTMVDGDRGVPLTVHVKECMEKILRLEDARVTEMIYGRNSVNFQNAVMSMQDFARSMKRIGKSIK